MDPRPHQVCRNCVMDTSDVHIVFDESGVCDHCRTFERSIKPNWRTDAQGRAEIERIAADIRKEGRKRDFDCIIGMSGGIDSSYLVYLCLLYTSPSPRDS